jgi:hypothetical protein
MLRPSGQGARATCVARAQLLKCYLLPSPQPSYCVICASGRVKGKLRASPTPPLWPGERHRLFVLRGRVTHLVRPLLLLVLLPVLRCTAPRPTPGCVPQGATSSSLVRQLHEITASASRSALG